jgi:hypothetical protein
MDTIVAANEMPAIDKLLLQMTNATQSPSSSSHNCKSKEKTHA